MEKELSNILKRYEIHPDFLGVSIEDINQVGGMDDTVLHIAARNNYLNDALIFLQNGALIDIKGDLGYTPLHYACMFGNIEMVRLLLDNGANKNIQNEFGENAIKIAINSSSENKDMIVKLLNNFKRKKHK
ncbi:ankyrin repeat domain-containing protein [Neisseria zalophi]|uniref:Ankyrin repeat domain-containing protein n=1 Tax=Neisseria zalophi TaxID=640030 RepID=A0A5J6PZP7_9NEIS|nr:ankyrin repeat domain-containing protein [Neisseria zalophi]QEY25317.1 ankyrin repeat domain-containing protein [Neisseria zalophi]QEY26673.1 ankyrin repeat domain-containing protein [Neisseria zalophi]